MQEMDLSHKMFHHPQKMKNSKQQLHINKVEKYKREQI